MASEREASDCATTGVIFDKIGDINVVDELVLALLAAGTSG